MRFLKGGRKDALVLSLLKGGVIISKRYPSRFGKSGVVLCLDFGKARKKHID